MTNDVSNLILIQLRGIRDAIGDVKNLLANIEAAQATTPQHFGHTAGTVVEVQVGIDRQATRLGRIEDRLGLFDA